MASNDKQDSAILRGNIQAYLINSLKVLEPAMHKTRGTKFTRHLVHTKFDPAELVSQFNKTTGIDAYMRALPAQLSGLMPKIRIYLRQGEGTDGKSKPDIPVHFSGHTSATYTQATQGGNLDIFASQAKGRDVGITRFHVSIDNKFKFKSVQASMELYFKNMADLSQGPYLHLIKLMKKNQSYNKGGQDNPKTKMQALAQERKAMAARLKVDKAGRIQLGPAEKVRPVAKRLDPAPLKAVIGWATNKGADLPQDRTGNVPTRNLYNFLERSALTLLLNVNKYSIDFGDQGEIKLSIEMTGYADDSMSASDANIFTNPWKVQRSTPHPNVRNRTGNPIGVTDTKTKNMLRITEIFGKPIHELDLNALPRIRRARLKDGYFYSLLQQKKVALQTATVLSKNKARIRLDPEITQHLIAITQKDIEIVKLQSSADGGKELNKLRDNLSKLKKIHKKIGESIKGNVYRNFLERLEAAKGVMSFQVPATELGITAELSDENTDKEAVSTSVDATASRGRGLTSPPNFVAAQISSATFDAAGASSKEARKDQRGGLASSQPFTVSPAAAKNKDKDGNSNFMVPITFVRVGDILDTAFHSSGFFTHNLNKKEGTFRIVLDSVLIDLPKEGVTSFSLADIPIQLSAFEYFFFEKYVKRNVTNVPLRGFLDDFMKFVAAEMSNAGLTGEGTSQFEPFIVPFTAPNINGKPLKPGKQYTKTSVEFNTSTSSPRGFSVKREAESSINMEDLNNYIILSMVQNPSLPGEAKVDNGRGIYHLVLAAGRGPVKSIKFSEMDVSEHIRTMNIRDGSADFPTVPQNATVDLVGAPHFWQGQMVYIDADYAMENASINIGIGGYYFITKVTHDLNEGDFKTTLDCRWQAYKEVTPKSASKRSSNK